MVAHAGVAVPHAEVEERVDEEGEGDTRQPSREQAQDVGGLPYARTERLQGGVGAVEDHRAEEDAEDDEHMGGGETGEAAAHHDEQYGRRDGAKIDAGAART